MAKDKWIETMEPWKHNDKWWLNFFNDKWWFSRLYINIQVIPIHLSTKPPTLSGLKRTSARNLDVYPLTHGSSCRLSLHLIALLGHHHWIGLKGIPTLYFLAMVLEYKNQQNCPKVHKITQFCRFLYPSTMVFANLGTGDGTSMAESTSRSLQRLEITRKNMLLERLKPHDLPLWNHNTYTAYIYTLYMYVYIYICMYIYIYNYTYIHIYIHISSPIHTNTTILDCCETIILGTEPRGYEPAMNPLETNHIQ